MLTSADVSFTDIGMVFGTSCGNPNCMVSPQEERGTLLCWRAGFRLNYANSCVVWYRV